MSNFYRGNYVVRGEQVKRVINTNDMIAAKMQAIIEEQKQAQREEMIKKRQEALASGELDGEPEFTEGLFAQELELETEPEPQIDYVAQAKEQAAEKTEHRTIDREKVKVKDRSVQR